MKYMVTIKRYIRNQDTEIIERRVFHDEDKAVKFAAEFNNKYNEINGPIPNEYLQADYPIKVR